MSDGEINVAVRAEGVDDAAGEMDGALAEGDGDGEGGGGGIGAVASNTGRMARLLGVIVGLLAVFEDVLGVLNVVSDVLRGFVAPLAMMLMRLLQPVLRLLFGVLPTWLNWLDNNEGMLMAVAGPLLFFLPAIVEWVRRAAERIGGARAWLADVRESVESGFGDLEGWLSELPGRIWEFFAALPAQIGEAVADSLPSLPSSGEVTTGFGDAVQDRFDSVTEGRSGDAANTIIQFAGGLETFVDGVAKNRGVDWP